MTQTVHTEFHDTVAALTDGARSVVVLAERLAMLAIAGEPPPDWSGGGVQHVEGFERVGDIVRRRSLNARDEVLAAHPHTGDPSSSHVPVDAVREQLRSGVRWRILYQHTARFDEATKAYVREATTAGAEVRTLDEFFERLIVVDRTIAFISTARDLSEVLVITHPALTQFLANLFDRHWDRGDEFSSATMPNSSAAELIMPSLRDSIRRLLIAGYPDKTIARRLGISQRSLQEHVARLKTSVGATNRLQLGYLLGRSDGVGQEASVDVRDGASRRVGTGV